MKHESLSHRHEGPRASQAMVVSCAAQGKTSASNLSNCSSRLNITGRGQSPEDENIQMPQRQCKRMPTGSVSRKKRVRVSSNCGGWRAVFECACGSVCVFARESVCVSVYVGSCVRVYVCVFGCM